VNLMKSALFFTTPLLAFITALMLAGLVPPDTSAGHKEPPNRANSLKRKVMQDSKSASTDIPALLADMERKIVYFSPPEVVAHDGKDMEEALISDEQSQGTCAGGMEAISYAHDWARENPAGMFEWFNEHWTVSGHKRQYLAKTLFAEWATQDMAAALAAIPRMAHAESRAQALVSTLEVLCRKDPVKARELLLQNLDALGALKSVQLGYEADKSRADLILSLPPGRVRSLLLAEYIGNLVLFGYEGNGVLATELWNQRSAEERRDMVVAGLRRCEMDKVQLEGLEDITKQHAETSGDPEQALLFIKQYGAAWAKRDAGSALAWSLARLKGKERNECALDLLADAASQNFDAAMQAWKGFGEGTLREKAAEQLFSNAPSDRETDKALLEEAMPKPGKW
jgi:hypothetical protein